MLRPTLVVFSLLMPGMSLADVMIAVRGSSLKPATPSKIGVAALVILLAAPYTAAAQTLRLATFNCEFLVIRKVHMKYDLPFTLLDDVALVWDQPGFRQRKFDEAVGEVAKEVQAINADVIVLTEIGGQAEVTALHQATTSLGLDYPHTALCKSTDTRTGQHVAIFSHLELHDVLSAIPGREFYDKEPDDTDEEGNTGLSKGMRVTIEFAGETIYLYAAHLKSEMGYSESDGQRIAQASIVRRHYLPLLNSGEHLIVAGDLNDKRGDPAIRRIRGRDDLFADLIQTGAPEYWEDDQLGERWTYQYLGVRNQIDHILPSRSLRDAAKIRASVHEPTGVLPGGHAVTDHRGLIVEFEW